MLVLFLKAQFSAFLWPVASGLIKLLYNNLLV